VKASKAERLGLIRERRIGPEGAIVERWVTPWTPIEMTRCERPEAHGPHAVCPGLPAHPEVMIGKANVEID
jgi:hypothetical protein